jgi:hypothetical protein
MSEKKNGEYDKPTSHKMGGEDLEDISAGAGTVDEGCRGGPGPGSWGPCVSGGSTGQGDCSGGGQPEKLGKCTDGATAYTWCTNGGHNQW